MPVGKTRMATIIMATLKCLACGHDNKVGDESCLSCSSSLNLKLCGACEAINANRAERCHSCGAAFNAPEPAAVPVLEDAVAFVELAPSKSLPAKIRFVETVLPSRSRARAVALWTPPLVILVAMLAYYLNGRPSVNAQPSAVAQAPAAVAPVRPAAPQASAAPQARTEAARPVAKATQPGARSATVQPRASTEAKRPAAITHTRAGAESAPPAVPAPAPTKTIAAKVNAAPEAKTAPTSLAAPGFAAPAAPAYGRVTHTRPPAPGTAPAAQVPSAQPPPTALKNSSLACAPAVAALGLCSTK
jgi:hypothetical protein